MWTESLVRCSVNKNLLATDTETIVSTFPHHISVNFRFNNILHSLIKFNATVTSRLPAGTNTLCVS
jgi:hypothetical protein